MREPKFKVGDMVNILTRACPYDEIGIVIKIENSDQYGPCYTIEYADERKGNHSEDELDYPSCGMEE